MKLSNVLLFTASAVAAFQLTKHKDRLIEEGIETKELVEENVQNFQAIKDNLSHLQEETQVLKEIGKELSYRTKVLTSEANAHVEQIQQIWNKEK